MANKIFLEDNLAIEMIATGRTIDDDPGFKGDRFEIITWTFRMNHIGLDLWWKSEPIHWDEWYPYTREEFDKKSKERTAAREDLEAKIREFLQIDGCEGFSVTRNVSEIFTAVLIRKIIPAEEGEK